MRGSFLEQKVVFVKQQQTPGNVAGRSYNSLIFALTLTSVYLFWGGTFLAMKIGMETIPVFLMVAARALSAGFILYGSCRLSGQPRPTAIEWRNGAIVGALLLVGSNAVVTWAVQLVPTSIASVVVATVPLWIASYSFLARLQKPSVGSILGIFLGLCGIVVLVWNPGEIAAHSLNLFGIFALLFASLSWSTGAIYSRTARMPATPLLSTGVQLIAGGVMLTVIALIHGDFSGFSLAQVSLRSWLAFGYLVVFGSLVGFTSFAWLFKNVKPTIASTYAFVNPIVAVFLGWFFGGEQLGANAFVSAGIIIAAVFCITVFGSARGVKTAAETGEDAAAEE